MISVTHSCDAGIGEYRSTGVFSIIVFCAIVFSKTKVSRVAGGKFIGRLANGEFL